MSSWRWTAVTVVVIGTLLLNLSAAQTQPAVPQSGDQSDLLSTVYVPPNNFGFQEVYDLLRQHNVNLPISPAFCRRHGHQIVRMNTKRWYVHSV
ncbi:MAG TPA: hypothetical protein VGH47_13440 [Xanthobacteraceae bacterium]|jgi:hypothetical protein